MTITPWPKLSQTPAMMQIQSDVKALKELLAQNDFICCEDCQKLFIQSEEDVRTHEYRCTACRPQEEDFDQGLEDSMAYLSELSNQI